MERINSVTPNAHRIQKTSVWRAHLKADCRCQGVPEIQSVVGASNGKKLTPLKNYRFLYEANIQNPVTQIRQGLKREEMDDRLFVVMRQLNVEET